MPIAALVMVRLVHGMYSVGRASSRATGDPGAPGQLGFGEGGIRTHGTRKGTAVFKTAAFDHSATSPNACKSLRQLTFSLNTVSHKVTSRLTVSHIAATILLNGDSIRPKCGSMWAVPK